MRGWDGYMIVCHVLLLYPLSVCGGYYSVPLHIRVTVMKPGALVSALAPGTPLCCARRCNHSHGSEEGAQTPPSAGYQAYLCVHCVHGLLRWCGVKKVRVKKGKGVMGACVVMLGKGVVKWLVLVCWIWL